MALGECACYVMCVSNQHFLVSSRCKYREQIICFYMITENHVLSFLQLCELPVVISIFETLTPCIKLTLHASVGMLPTILASYQQLETSL